MKDPRFNNDPIQAASISEYFANYTAQLKATLDRVDMACLEKAFSLLEDTLKNKGHVYVAGNGGSAAIADHLCCDWMKGTFEPSLSSLKVHSLSSNNALLTAIANDYGYEKSFSSQLEMLLSPGDLVVLVSSSGNSPNIVSALASAKKCGAKTIGLCGFEGGLLRSQADVALYVAAKNYGIVEDSHQMLMHVIAQYLAKKRDERP